MDAETEFVQACVDAVEQGTLKLSTPQRERLNKFYDFKGDLDKIEGYRTMLTEIEGVYDKINTFLEKRAEHEASEHKSASHDLPE